MLVAKLSGHTNTILSLDFSPTVVRTTKGTKAAGEVALLCPSPPIWDAPSNRRPVAQSSWDGTLRIWDWQQSSVYKHCLTLAPTPA